MLIIPPVCISLSQTSTQTNEKICIYLIKVSLNLFNISNISIASIRYYILPCLGFPYLHLVLEKIEINQIIELNCFFLLLHKPEVKENPMEVSGQQQRIFLCRQILCSFGTPIDQSRMRSVLFKVPGSINRTSPE